MAEWEINKPLGRCWGRDKAIESGEDFFAALVETEEGLVRRDFCEEYWESQKPAAYCYWKSRMAQPDQKKQLFVDDEMLMSFFQRLENETDQEKINFRFVLALVLMRKRRFKYDGSKVEGESEIWRLKVVGEGRNVEVADPHLDEEQIEQLSSQIGVILHVEL